MQPDFIEKQCLRKRLQLCIDIDNVIAATDAVLREAIRIISKDRVQLDYDDIVNFDYWRCQDKNGQSISRHEWDAAHLFFSSTELVSQVEPLPGAVDALWKLSKYADLHLVTSRIPAARRATVEWVERMSLPTHSLHFAFHREKHKFFQALDAAIEDDYDQGVAFTTNLQAKSVLLKHPWNATRQPQKGLVWANDWNDVLMHLSP